MKPLDLLKRTTRIASGLALAAGAPAFLSAALTVTPENGITELWPGATLTLEARLDGAAPAGALQWILLEDGHPVPQDDDNPLVRLGPAGTVSFRPAVAGHSRTFTFQVRHGDQISDLVAVRVVGAGAASGAGAVSSAGAASSASAGPASSAGAASSLLVRLPRVAKGIVASHLLPGSSQGADTEWGFKAVNREWRQAAGDATRTIRTVGAITNAAFLATIRTHRRVRRIEIPVASGLTTQGLIAGLKEAPELEALEVVMTDSIVTDEVLLAVGCRLRELDLNTEYGHETCTDVGLRACTRLGTLKLVHGPRVTGAGLPASLRRLAINACHAFDSANLPHDLHHLSVGDCGKFGPFAIRTALRSLELRDFDWTGSIRSTQLRTMLEGNTTLRSLKVEMPDDELAFLPLPTDLEELSLWTRGDVLRCDFTSCTRLLKLELSGYSGDLERAFPPSLQELELANCTGFRGESAFPERLSRLKLSSCNNFTGKNLAGGITDLVIRECRRVTRKRLTKALGRMPKLLELAHGRGENS